MSVLIKGMEMPKCCEVCKFCDVDAENFCEVTFNYIPLTEGRPKDCPLVEVPEPHGDLIDRTKLYNDTANWEAQALEQVSKYNPSDSRDEWRWWSAVLKERSAFKHDVADAPTVIEAEEQDND